MAAIDVANEQFIANANLIHQVVHGDANTVVQTETGSVRSLAKLMADNQANIDGKVNADQVGVAGGIAELDESGLIPAERLPSFVDDVVEFPNFAALPGVGESGKIYIVVAHEGFNGQTRQYRWTGTQYAPIMAAPDSTDNVVEGVTNKYFTAARVRETLLAGIDFASGLAITAADSVLGALGKLQAQVTAALGYAKGYDFHAFIPAKPAAGATVFVVKTPRTIVFPQNGAGSQAEAKTAATAAASFSLLKEGVEFGKMNFAAGAAIPTFAIAVATEIAAGGKFSVIAPAAQDATLADVAMSFLTNQK